MGRATPCADTVAPTQYRYVWRLGGPMDDHIFEDLVRRLTALVVKLDERDDHILALIEEQREFNRQQVRINTEVSATLARLETLMTEVFRERHNGRDA